MKWNVFINLHWNKLNCPNTVSEMRTSKRNTWRTITPSTWTSTTTSTSVLRFHLRTEPLTCQSRDAWPRPPTHTMTISMSLSRKGEHDVKIIIVYYRKHQGGVSQNLSSVTNDSFCYKLLKSLLLIGYQQICHWFVIEKGLCETPPGPRFIKLVTNIGC